MPQLQAISLNDRETTPVAHAFVPSTVTDGVGVVSRYNGVLLGEETLSVSSRRASGKLRAKIVLRVPVVQNETINGIVKPNIVRTGFVAIDFVFDESSTEQERKNLIGMIQDALTPAKLLVNDAIVKGEGIYR